MLESACQVEDSPGSRWPQGPSSPMASMQYPCPHPAGKGLQLQAAIPLSASHEPSSPSTWWPRHSKSRSLAGSARCLPGVTLLQSPTACSSSVPSPRHSGWEGASSTTVQWTVIAIGLQGNSDSLAHKKLLLPYSHLSFSSGPRFMEDSPGYWLSAGGVYGAF